MAPRPLPKRQFSGIRVSEVSAPVNSSTPLDPSGLVTQCAGSPPLAKAAETLRKMDKFVGQIVWSKEECMQLRNTSLVLLLVIRDHWENGLSEKPELERAIERTASTISRISTELKKWAKQSTPASVRSNLTSTKISDYEESLIRCIDFLGLTGILYPTTHTPIGKYKQDLDRWFASNAASQVSRKQTFAALLLGDSAVASAEPALDLSRLAACCAHVPGLAPVVDTLPRVHASVERLPRKEACTDQFRKLSRKVTTLIFITCDHYGNVGSDSLQTQNTIDSIVRLVRDLETDLRGWARLPFWRRWSLGAEMCEKINEREVHLKTLTESLSLTATLELHDQVVAIQESLKKNPNASVKRKQAEEDLYHKRYPPPGESANQCPPELAGECVRLGAQPEYSGSRNDIWKGRWLDKQEVALIYCKEYKMGARDDNSAWRFERQIRVWRKLNNPYVLRLYGWCKFDGETYLVSPWLTNRDVVRYLDGDRSRHRKCVALIFEIARGLLYLHNEDVIHGSLKPSNILIQADGRACLSDFSLAKFATADAKNTQTNPQVNVFRYQAPEVIMDEPISKASDVYSWAMTALEIITGDPPFHTWKSPGQLVAQVIMKNQVPARSDYNSSVLDKHPKIWKMFERCWSREPKDRPTAKKVVDMLEKIPDPE